jgi:outer membrane receptor protein involved in Fe transport
MHTIKQRTLPRYTLAAVSALVVAGSSWAQSASESAEIDEEDVIVLSPFEVSAEEEAGYQAATTLAGNRLNTELRDIGNAVTVITSQFLKDIAATDNESLLQYTVGTEVGNIQGNFAGVGDSSFLDESSRFKSPNQNTRVRGLTSADNTRDYFLSDIPWDGYNVDRVDLQRGPNSILFGQGSPSGIINVGTKQAAFKNSSEVGFRVGSYGSTRVNVDFNRVLLDDELAVRVAAVRDDTNYQQDPAFQDSERVYGAVRYEPSFLKQGSARTIFKANFEKGDVQSNRPRTLPPLDLITPWFETGTYNGTWKTSGTDIRTGQQVNVGDVRVFNHLNQETFNPHQLQDDNTGRVNHGQVRPGINGGPNAGQPNPYFNPWIGNYGQMFGGPSFAYSDGSQTQATDRRIWEIKETRGIGPSGAVDQDIGSWAFHRPGGIATQATYARNAGLPFSEFGVYKDNQLTDPSIFDFYNNLIDGPNKSEWSDWDTFNLSLAQTFMNDKFGFEVTHNEEFFNNGQLAFLSGNRQAINIDINNQFADSTPDGGLVAGGEPHANGTPNPNVGRAFITDSGQFGNNSYESERDSTRITGFLTHDFNDDRSDNWLRKILGSHTWTGLWAEDEQSTDSRNWQSFAIDDDNYFNFIGASNSTLFTDNNFAVNRAIYLGPSLLGKSIEGANIPRPTAVAGVPSNTTIRVFDSTWNAPGVDQAAYWRNGYQLPGPNQDSTQSENWANYVGWIDYPVNIVDSETSAAARQRLTTSARLTRSTVDSKAFVWQAKLLENGLVGTWGYREDTARSWGKQLNTTDSSSDVRGHLDLTPSNYKLGNTPDNELEVTSKSYSIVAHLDELPFIGKFTERLPMAVSLYYNNSTNFQPSAQRVDAYGEPIAAPAGKTLDRGILLESRDGRYTLKVNSYKTSVVNASSSGLNGAWFIGASQAWSAGWVNKFEFNLKGGYTIDRALNPNNPTDTEVNYGTAPGETLADAQAREAAAIAAWRTYQASVDPRFYAAWQLDPYDTSKQPSSSNPLGFAVTEDSVSEGYEIEFSALPTKNWRLTLNASKTTAVRNNIGGAALSDFIGKYENALKNTAAGDLRIWWGGAGNETALFQWNNNIGSEWAARKLQEGTNVPELREWRFNAISNYDFTEGRLAGFSIGAALRWQDDVVIGYPPLTVPNDPTSISFDLANPYLGPTELNVDAWIGYGKRLSDKIDWRIQLNVRNLGDGDGLIPITTQPDGTPAGYRIAPSQNWYLTNTFKF